MTFRIHPFWLVPENKSMVSQQNLDKWEDALLFGSRAPFAEAYRPNRVFAVGPYFHLVF